jgi:ankyrin repeat protein
MLLTAGKIAQFLVEHGADIDAQSESGSTALMLHLESGHFDTAKLLAEKGANVRVQNGGGVTALMWAAQLGNLEMVKLLIEKGADVNVRDKDGESALTRARAKGNDSVVTFLFRSGADDLPARDTGTEEPRKQDEASTCSACGKALRDSLPEALFGRSQGISDSVIYPCKSCGAVYCIDCMSLRKKAGGTCLRCGRDVGW